MALERIESIDNGPRIKGIVIFDEKSNYDAYKVYYKYTDILLLQRMLPKEYLSITQPQSCKLSYLIWCL